MNVKKLTPLFLLTICTSLLLVQCTVYTTKEKDPVFNRDSKSIFYDITGVIGAAEVNVTGTETKTDGKTASELRISLINPKQLPTDTSEISQIGNEIATIIKRSLKNDDAFNSYKVLFINRHTDGAITKSTSVSRNYEYENIRNYAFVVTLGTQIDSSKGRAFGKSTFNQNDVNIVVSLSYYDYDRNIPAQVKMIKETDTAFLLMTTRDLGKLNPGHNYLVLNWKVADFYKTDGMKRGVYRFDYFIRDTLVGSRTFTLL